MSKKMRCAIIGCGTIGNTHANHYAASPHGDLVTVCDIIKDKATAFAAKYNVPTAVKGYKAILADNTIDTVSVCLPNHLHESVSIACLNAGKHVLCEKPIALNMKQAANMQTAAKRNKKLLAIGVVNRFHDNINYIKGMIDRGELGEVYHVFASLRAHRSIPGLGGWFTTKRKSGGGVMIDCGVHYIDLILYCLGFPKAKSISGAAYAKLARNMKDYAFTSMWAGPPNYDGVCDVEESFTALLRTAGPNISMEGAWARNIGVTETYIDFLGTLGGVRLQYGGDFVVYSHKDGVLFETKPSVPQKNMFQNEIDDFLQCARTGRKSRADINSVIGTQKILDAFYLSAKKNREVPV